MTTQQKEQIRKPVQERSQKRVELILEAAQSLIVQKGAAHMKMSDVAETAGISIGSIYQYFPNKGAIVAALAERILQINTEKNAAILSEPPKSLVQLSNITTQLLDQYYELQMQHPVLRDILAGFASDKDMMEAENDDTIANRDYIFEMSKHLFREEEFERAKMALLLIISFGGAAVNVAVQFDVEESNRAMDDAKAMLYAAWEASILPLGNKH